MKATFKSIGKKSAIFTVSGTTEELETYKTVQGNYYREDEESKVPLYFLSKRMFTSKEFELEVTQDGERIFAVTKVDDLIKRNQEVEVRMLLQQRAGEALESL